LPLATELNVHVVELGDLIVRCHDDSRPRLVRLMLKMLNFQR